MGPNQTHQSRGGRQTWRRVHPHRPGDHRGRTGRGDPAGNFQLRTAIAKARAAGVPAANIERAIAKGSGQAGDGANALETIRYEGYAAGGVAVLVNALTDNRNRTAADVRLAFSKNGGNLESGCVSYLFSHRSEVRIAAPEADSKGSSQGPIDEEVLLEDLPNMDADGYELSDDGTALVHGSFEALEALQNGLREQGWSVQEWEHCWHPSPRSRFRIPTQHGSASSC